MGTIDKATNTLDGPDPRFDARYTPQAPEYARVGYRPVRAPATERSRRP
jgi:hypothetical protein